MCVFNNLIELFTLKETLTAHPKDQATFSFRQFNKLVSADPRICDSFIHGQHCLFPNRNDS